MNPLKLIKKKKYVNKIKSLNVSVDSKEDKKIINAMFGIAKSDKEREHQLKCFELSALNIQLKKLGELCGRKECGNILQKEPFVVQCYTCQKSFSDEKGVSFAGRVKNLNSQSNIFNHLTTCEGIICDCGNKVFFFDTCKKCKRKWDKRAIYYLGFRKDYPFTKRQKEQMKKYKILISKKTNGSLDNG